MTIGLTLYDVLGISRNATTEDGSSFPLFGSEIRPADSYHHFYPDAVRKAYKVKALETHPDKLDPTATERQRHAAEGKFRNV